MPFMTGTKMGYPSDIVSPVGREISSVDIIICHNGENSNTCGENVLLNRPFGHRLCWRCGLKCVKLAALTKSLKSPSFMDGVD